MLIKTRSGIDKRIKYIKELYSLKKVISKFFIKISKIDIPNRVINNVKEKL